MDLEAIVVDCRPADDGTSLGWEVTLLFDSVTPAQVSALRAASRIQLHHEALPSDGAFWGSREMGRPGLN